MDITNELLAAYAEGNVSESERNTVRQYLTDNPDELETLMIMMDEDYEIEIDDETNEDRVIPLNDDLFSDICYSSAAFAPRSAPATRHIESPGHADNKSFNQRIDDLLDELDT